MDDTVIAHFPELEADITDPGSRAMPIRHIAAMSSGHEQETWGDAVARDPQDPVRGFLLIPPDRPPGTVFAYNHEVGWATVAGRDRGFTGLHARTEDVAKLGQLYLQCGQWDGVQLLSREWVAEATSKRFVGGSEWKPPAPIRCVSR